VSRGTQTCDFLTVLPLEARLLRGPRILFLNLTLKLAHSGRLTIVLQCFLWYHRMCSKSAAISGIITPGYNVE